MGALSFVLKTSASIYLRVSVARVMHNPRIACACLLMWCDVLFVQVRQLLHYSK